MRRCVCGLAAGSRRRCRRATSTIAASWSRPSMFAIITAGELCSTPRGVRPMQLPYVLEAGRGLERLKRLYRAALSVPLFMIATRG